MTTMRVVGECFFCYRLTRVFPDKFHRAVKRLCCVCVCFVVLACFFRLHYIIMMLMMINLDISDHKETSDDSEECGVHVLDYKEIVDVSEKCGAAATNYPLDTNVSCVVANESGRAQDAVVRARPQLSALRAVAQCAGGAALARVHLARFHAPPSITSEPASTSVTPQQSGITTLHHGYSTNIDSGKYCFCL